MNLNTIIIIVIAAFVWFGLRKPSPGSNVTQNTQLPPNAGNQPSSAATALISEGIGATESLLGKLIDGEFARGSQGAPPDTGVMTL